MAQAGGEPITTQIATGGPSTGAITYTSGDTAVATVDAMTGAVTMVGAGETTITATRAIDARYEATEASYKLIVATAQVKDAFVFPVETMMAFAGDGPLTIQIASDGQSAGTITYTSSNPAVATVDATTGAVTILKAGTVIITATRAMDTLYAATEADYTLTVATARATDTLSFPTITFMAQAGGEPITTQIATSGQSTLAPSYASGNPAVATVDARTGVVTIVKAGVVRITATRARDARYQAAEASYTLTVARAMDTLSFPSRTIMAFADDDPTAIQLAGGGQGGGVISYRSDDTAVATVHTTTGVVTIVKAGEIRITATRAMDARYQAAEASYTLTITRATDTLSFPSETIMAFADDDPTAIQLASGGQGSATISYRSDDTAVATVHTTTGVVTIVKAGEIRITATRAGDARYQAAEASYTLTVARAMDTLSFPSRTIMAFADDDPTAIQLAGGGQGGGVISYRSDDTAVATVHTTTGVVTIVKAGEIRITATRAGDARYQAAEASYTLTVAPARIMDTLSFPLETIMVFANAEPTAIQLASGGQGSGAISYRSEDTAVATVETGTGVVTILKAGTAMITATRAGDARYQAAEASYSLSVILDTIISTHFTTSDGGREVSTTHTYTSGIVESISEHIGIESQFGLDCDGDGLRNTLVLRIITFRGLGTDMSTCEPTDKVYPDLPPLNPEELDRRLQGAMSFSPTYIEDHGEIIETEETSDGIESATTNRHTSGLLEVISVQEFDESQQGLDYNNDGDLQDLVHLRTVVLDYFVYSQHLQILTERGGTVLEDFGIKIGNATRRINMPQGIPSFLRFNGAIDNIVIQIAPTATLGQYHVKIDNSDPSVQFITQRITDVPDATPDVEELRPDFFARAPLIEDTTTTSYAIYAVKGELYQTVLEQYPNFYVRYDFVNFLIPTLLQKTLDENRSIVVNADVPEFLDYYDSVRVEFDPFQASSSYSGGVIFISSGHIYAPRPLIHEATHGYHANSLPKGFNNEEIKALYALVPSDRSMRYGDEQNSYWRTNQLEFFAEALTTWLYLESEVVTPGFSPIAEVDSTFYYAHLKPWFDNHFNKED